MDIENLMVNNNVANTNFSSGNISHNISNTNLTQSQKDKIAMLE